ncbi:MAG: GNAT family N-acetyltransferase [candidate division Zixibacteria bacterium]|nr:GNAT family N-acetyltransferase [candidate division Zixibacteria bacterium]
MNLILIENPDARWDEFISKYPHHLIFHTSIWAQILKISYDTKLAYYVLEDKEEWLLAIPGMLTGRFLKLWYSLIPYGGFIGKKEYIPTLLKFITRDIRKYKIDRLEIIDPEVSQPSEIRGFVGKESYRHILNLENKTEEDIWKNYKPNLRRTIGEALDAKLSIEKTKDSKEVELFYNLYLESMRRQRGVVRYPLELFRGIFSLIEQGKGDIFFAKHEGIAIAGIVIIYSEDMAHYFHGGSLSKYLNLRPNDLLFHTAIKEAMRRGKKQFDFMGSAKNLTGLIQFKEKWGTERKSLYALRQDMNRLKSWLHEIAVPYLRFCRGRD